jgi:hypothetical protein
MKGKIHVETEAKTQTQFMDNFNVVNLTLWKKTIILWWSKVECDTYVKNVKKDKCVRKQFNKWWMSRLKDETKLHSFSFFVQKITLVKEVPT